MFGTDLFSSNAAGQPVDLPGAIRERFEDAFGADLSAVKIYRSQAVADAGAQAVTMGEKVAFAPGMLDFSSRSGLSLLGHEMSHVVSQQRGEVTGSGFLNDPALEARADREGAMAAAGQSIDAPTAALSPVSAAGASGPMQAKKDIQQLAGTYNNGNNAAAIPQNSFMAQNYQYNNPLANGPGAEAASNTSKGSKYASDYFKSTYNLFGGIAKSHDAHFARVDQSKLTTGNWGGAVSPWFSAVNGGIGFLGGALTAYSGGASAIRNLKNLKAGASKADALEDGLTSLGGLGTMGSGGVAIAKMASSGFADMLKAGGSMQNLLPGLSIATGGANMIAGAMQGFRGAKRWHDISSELDTVSARNANNLPNGQTADDQQKMLRTMRHGLEIQKRNTALGAFKGVGGLLSGIGGVLSLGGVTSPLGLALSAAGAFSSGLGSIYNLWKNRRLRKNAIAEELGGTSYLDAINDVRSRLAQQGHKHISRSNAWKIYLESKGMGNKTEDDMYKDIRQRRAAHMLQMAQGGDPMAKSFVESMGVKEVELGNNQVGFASGAVDLLAEKLK